MGHSKGFGYAPWAIAQYLQKLYGTKQRIWLCDMGHSTGFGSALCTIALDIL
jgi:3-deoxy-D-manno-octulosonic acid (KDO) 8-phosphate synthase